MALSPAAEAARGGKGHGGGGGGGGGSKVAISIVDSGGGIGAQADGTIVVTGDSVSFSVDVSAKNIGSLWVANKCRVDGSLVSVQHQPVIDGVAGPFSLAAAAGGGECRAYAWEYPNSGSPIRGAELTYVAN